MKIICFSDTHGQHRRMPEIPECDVLIFAGDIMSGGHDMSELISFNAWLGKKKAAHRIVIAGNHDFLFERYPDQSRAMLSNATYLENSGVTIDGLNFWGSPYTPSFYNWAFMADRGEAIQKHWDLIPDNTDVLITHGPPFGILDTTWLHSPEHLGCVNLLEAVVRVKPKLHVFGHIHGGHGKVESDAGIFCNASMLNEAYDMVYPVTTITL